MGKTSNDKKNPVNVFVGRNLRYFMDSNDISEQELADGFGIEKESLQRILNGTNGISSIYCNILAMNYNCDMNLIFRGISEEDMIQVEDGMIEKQDARQVLKDSMVRQLHYLADILDMMQ
ncbi:MAG: helix-turn-helix transcriptional regulator [Lachnospiraceae bacterium]|nr:helix-turn-helix transcriptional regulator [Lachnospiraceae bacterium]